MAYTGEDRTDRGVNRVGNEVDRGFEEDFALPLALKGQYGSFF